MPFVIREQALCPDCGQKVELLLGMIESDGWAVLVEFAKEKMTSAPA